VPYTLAKFFLWGLLMALAGGIVGWLLRSLKARTDLARSQTPVDASDVDRLRRELEPVVAERDRLRMELADVRGSSAGALGFSSTVDTSIIPPNDGDWVETREPTEVAAPEPGVAADPSPAELDLDAAAAVLGKKVALDALTVVEGIGPKIAELCAGIGVTTWDQLAATDVEELQSMLDAAGSRFQMHKPASWPQQAALLASGQWEEFVAMTESPAGG
jgi:predicted flap endonuclease-1-like 5' DNA nuclease